MQAENKPTDQAIKRFSLEQALTAAKALHQSRIGLMGHYYGGMLDVYSDYTQLSSVFGNHFELVEMDELKSIRDAAAENDIDEMLAEFAPKPAPFGAPAAKPTAAPVVKPAPKE